MGLEAPAPRYTAAGHLQGRQGLMMKELRKGAGVRQRRPRGEPGAGLQRAIPAGADRSVALGPWPVCVRDTASPTTSTRPGSRRHARKRSFAAAGQRIGLGERSIGVGEQRTGARERSITAGERHIGAGQRRYGPGERHRQGRRQTYRGPDRSLHGRPPRRWGCTGPSGASGDTARYWAGRYWPGRFLDRWYTRTVRSKIGPRTPAYAR